MRFAFAAVLSALAGFAVLPLAVPPAQAAGESEGAALFGQHCGSCHTLVPGKPSIAGPNLSGMYGRKAAKGEFRYSAALQASGLVWNRENLDSFLAAPMSAVPGTRMPIAMRDKAKRAAIIDYLAKAAK